nr:MAG TPA: hypothetical protein [Caudoviricetes sp.]
MKSANSFDKIILKSCSLRCILRLKSQHKEGR